ncbi:DUF6124 family protein [Pseudomonas ovata]|uniref:DUF6124 family protein n=1 Tax=Pseudomonas ovata TaxID=1839709 RepID=UPI001F4E4F6E|nr:hypothetical protein [Pseudomonas ovata]
MKKIVPDPPGSTPTPAPGTSLISFEDQLNHVSELLGCANATAYECGDNLCGEQRALAMATTHLIAQAQGVIDLMIDHLPPMPER